MRHARGIEADRPFKKALKRAAVTVGRMIARPARRARPVVLCYHSVHPRRPYASSTPQVFERQLQWLKEHYEIVSFADLVISRSISDSGRPTAVITFDDGYSDNHVYALPLLVKYGVQATFFVTAGFLERDQAVLGRFEHLLGCLRDQFPPLDWAQVREMRASGMTIGSHTYSHPNLARLPAAAAREELRISKDLISDRLSAAVDVFAYPFGKPRVHFTAATIEQVRAAGYRAAAAVTFRAVGEGDAPYRIPRFTADSDSVSKLEAKMTGAYDLIGLWQERAPLAAMRTVSPLDFER